MPRDTQLPGESQTQAGTRPSLHPRETELVAITIIHLCFLPWALGTMHVWSQLTSLALACVGFVLAMLPRRGTSAAGAGQPAGRLWRFPVFWAGLALLGYIMAQGANPAWRFMSNSTSWWLEPAPHVTWLPSGVATSFASSNPWRAVVILGSAWLLVCSVWSGFLRRRSYRVLFTALAANALLLALLGLVQDLNGTDRIFWSYAPSNDKFIASFIYPNHAGPYFNLMFALAAGLAAWHLRRAQSGLDSPAWAAGFSVVAVGCAVLVLYSGSRGSILLLAAFALPAGGGLLFRFWRRRRPARNPAAWIPLATALLLAGILGAGLVSLRAEKLSRRFAELAANPAATGRARTVARQAAGEMWRDRWLLGWGAGCFRHLFPLYAQRHPEIYHTPWGGRARWEHAHSDLLEFPLELGVAGLLPLAGMLAAAAWQLARHRFWRHTVPLALVAALLLLFLHAAVDFVFQNPAVLFTASVLLAGAIRWIELDPVDAAPSPRH